MNIHNVCFPPNQRSFWKRNAAAAQSETEDKPIIKPMVKFSKAVASFPPRFAGTPSKLTKVYCCLKSYRPHCIVISCILLFSSVFCCCVVFPTQGYMCQDFCNNLGEYAWTNSMTSWIQHFTKEIFMKICVETVLKKIKVLQLKWSGIDTQFEPFHIVTWRCTE